MTFPGALCGSEHMYQRDSYHHNSSLHLAYHFLFEHLFIFLYTFRLQTHHVVLQCIPGSEHCSITASKTLFYLLFLNNCLQASAVLKNVNTSDSEMKRHTQISLKLKTISKNFTHEVKSQNIHISA